MPGRLPFLVLLLSLALLHAPPRALSGEDASETAGVHRFTLENGLRVLLRPVEGAQDVCVLVLFDVGEDHDPQGQSGLAHLVEQVYVTAAAGDVGARTAEAMMQAYPMRWNAQTGARYTVVAFVEPAERLAPALAEAAARMGALEITDEIVRREQLRIQDELMNMYRNMPALAAHNRALGLVRPSPRGGRKGGIPAEVSKLTAADVRERHRTFYKPVNARLVVAGAFDADTAREAIEEAFSGIERGTALPEIGLPAPGAERLDVLRSSSLPPGQTGVVALAFRAPRPEDEAYGPFLFVAARLFQESFAARQQGRLPAFDVAFAPLDAPDVLVLSTAMTAKGGPEFHAAAMRKALLEGLERPPTPFERVQANQNYAFLLGTFPLVDAQLAMNPYGLAFRLGRTDQMGIDGGRVAEAIVATDEDDLSRLAKTVFASEAGVTAAVVPK